MKARIITALVALVILVAGDEVLGQAAKGVFPLAVRGQSQQNSIKVDTSTTPNRTEIGCEKDQEGGGSQPVNALRVVGAVTGANPSITAIPCTGGDTNIGITLTPAGTGSMTFGGVKAVRQVFPAGHFCQVTSTTTAPVVVRVAANDYGLRRTAAGAETINFGCTIPLIWSTTASKGARLDSFAIVQQIVTATLTSNTFNTLATTTYADNVANAVAAHGGSVTITMPTATQANPYVTTGTPGTPAFMTTSQAQLSLDWTVVMQNTGVYTVYAIVANYSHALY